MSTQIAKQISTRMRAKNLTLSSLENAAGLRTHFIQNILRGKSKKPSAESLQSIADVLGCTVKDLLGKNAIIPEETLTGSKQELLNRRYESQDLLMETLKFANKCLQEKDNHHLTIEQFMNCVDEIYIHSLQKDPRKIDKEFGEWWINLATVSAE